MASASLKKYPDGPPCGGTIRRGHNRAFGAIVNHSNLTHSQSLQTGAAECAASSELARQQVQRREIGNLYAKKLPAPAIPADFSGYAREA